MASQKQKVGEFQPETVSDRASSGHGVHLQIQPPSQGDRRLPPSYSDGNPLLESEDDGNTSSTQCCPVDIQHRVRIETRDPLEDYYEPKPYVPVNFDAVFTEPEEAGGLDIIYIINRAIYYWTKRCLYVIFSCLLGPILAFLFGITFAILQFIRIWMLNPVVRIWHMIISCLDKIYRPVIRTFIDPYFEAVGQVWRRIKFPERSYKVQVTGVALGQNAAHPQETA